MSLTRMKVLLSLLLLVITSVDHGYSAPTITPPPGPTKTPLFSTTAYQTTVTSPPPTTTGPTRSPWPTTLTPWFTYSSPQPPSTTPWPSTLTPWPTTLTPWFTFSSPFPPSTSTQTTTTDTTSDTTPLTTTSSSPGSSSTTSLPTEGTSTTYSPTEGTSTSSATESTPSSSSTSSTTSPKPRSENNRFSSVNDDSIDVEIWRSRFLQTIQNLREWKNRELLEADIPTRLTAWSVYMTELEEELADKMLAISLLNTTMLEAVFALEDRLQEIEAFSEIINPVTEGPIATPTVTPVPGVTFGPALNVEATYSGPSFSITQNVVLNNRDAYNRNTHEFIAPISGTYLFFLDAIPEDTVSNYTVDILKTDDQLGTVSLVGSTGPARWNTFTFNIAQLNTNDRLAVAGELTRGLVFRIFVKCIVEDPQQDEALVPIILD